MPISIAVISTATFTRPGTYVLRLAATSASDLRVAVEARNFKFHGKFWNARAQTLIVEWIPACLENSLDQRFALPIGQMPQRHSATQMIGARGVTTWVSQQRPQEISI